MDWLLKKTAAPKNQVVPTSPSISNSPVNSGVGGLDKDRISQMFADKEVHNDPIVPVVPVPERISLAQQIMKSKEADVVAPPIVIDAIPEAPIAVVVPVEVEQVPEPIPTTLPEVDETKVPEKTKHEEPVKTEIDHTNEPVDRVYLYDIFKDVGELLKKGKELESLSLSKAELEKEWGNVENFAAELKSDVKSIDDSLKALSSIEDALNPKDELLAVLEAYAKYFEKVARNETDAESGSRKKINALLLEINKLKTEIAGKVKETGGQEMFMQLKRFILKIESRRSIYQKSETTILEDRKKEVSEKSVNTERESGGILTERMQENDLISIFQLLYGSK